MSPKKILKAACSLKTMSKLCIYSHSSVFIQAVWPVVTQLCNLMWASVSLTCIYVCVLQFEGAEGEWFQKLTARFCSHQSWALDQIKSRQKKDPRFNSFIQVQQAQRETRKAILSSRCSDIDTSVCSNSRRQRANLSAAGYSLRTSFQ